MSQLAVDIVLLPPVPVMENIMRLIEYEPGSVIQLNTQTCLPHISLAMGVLNESNLGEVKNILDGLFQKTGLLKLEISRTQTKTIADGKNISEAVIDYNSELTNLHLDVMEALRSVLTHDNVRTDMFFSPPDVADISVMWVKHYFDKQTSDDFHPHITLGEGVTEQPKGTISFFAERLALCHLGSYCTARKIISENTFLID